ncbi:MAG: sugar phosphate isomerase/epimerase family protein [Planctomycetales bacterium]
MPFQRREFLRTSLATAGLIGAGGLPALLADDSRPPQKRPQLKKAVKFGMIGIQGSVEEKFNLIKSLGFEGVEMDSPSGINRDEVVAAVKSTGILVHGVVDSIHWKIRLSDPDPKIRQQGLEGMETALRDCKYYGGTTVLIVPGKVSDPKTENYEQVYARSQEQIKKAIPLAEELGVKIAIEVVWNDFITSPEQLVQYVDDFKSPTVGAYFDCSNMLKYKVPSEVWIRKLGPRMFKFDFKGYSHDKKWVKIGDGDENWHEIMKALADVGYNGWATAEVGGGGKDVLADISARMDRIFNA